MCEQAGQLSGDPARMLTLPEALRLRIQGMNEAGEKIPTPSSLAGLIADPARERAVLLRIAI